MLGMLMSSVWAWVVCFLLVFCRQKTYSWPQSMTKDALTWEDFKTSDGMPYSSFFHSIHPSISKWEYIELKDHFTILSMQVDHHSDSSWFMHSLHEKGSIGWNRTLDSGFHRRPLACSLRFFGVGLEKTLENYVLGGTGYVTLAFASEDKRKFWHGFDKNETNKVHCYYRTNKDTGSEFLDTPKTLGIAILCPITLDQEIGPFHFKRSMEDGYYCFPLSQYSVEVEVHLRPSSFDLTSSPETTKSIMSEFISFPAKQRHQEIFSSVDVDHRPHAVCTVQTFMNQFSGLEVI